MEFKYYIVLTITFVLVVIASAIQYLQHRNRLKKIRYRIHVNGTRGKSSVTRLIAAGLRHGGIQTCAKTTGTLPRMIMPDGREYPIFRPGKANISEQIRVVKTAVVRQVDALVMECMAVQPFLQWICERHMIRATHGVITNARADHLDVMGPYEEDVAKALAGMVPFQTKLFTCEKKHLAIIEQACADRKSECIALAENDYQKISRQDMDRFKYIEHPDNVALALAVCESLGVDRAVALKGMQQAEPDPGAMMDYEVNFFGRKLHFVNGFAANDPESSEQVWNISRAKFPHVKTRVLVFNCRVDRPDRSLQLGEAFLDWEPCDSVVLMGTGTYLFAKAAVRAGFPYHKIYYADDYNVEEIFELLVGLAGASSLIVGLGNIAGQGLEVVQHFKNRSILKEAA